MGPRRSHRKSRHGCPECKARRLKCDERNPCTNCVKHAISCSYVPPPDRQSMPASSTSPANQPVPQPPPHIYPQPEPVSHAATPNGSYSYPWVLTNSHTALESDTRFDLLHLLPQSPQETPVWPEDWGLDLELMHHWCTLTCDAMTLREDARYVWRVIIPTEGFLNKYVMHGLLAIAAVHRAYLYPAQRGKYSKVSAYHLATGLKEFRELISSPIDPNNWQPVFCFSSMITALLCTAPIRFDLDRWPAPLSNILEFFASVKGFQAIMKPFLPHLSRTQLAPLANSIWLESETMVRSPAMTAQSLLPADIWFQISRLHKFIDEYPFPQGQNDPGTQETSDIRKDYAVALDFYEISVRQLELAGPHVEAGMVFLWAYSLSKRFHDDLEAHRPAALVLLAHYCVLLQIVDHFWFVNGMARQLLADIESKMYPGFREWLVWPRRWVYGR